MALAPTSSATGAFSSFAASQDALRFGARLATAPIPPHVIIPRAGKWTYVYLPVADVSALTRVPAHTRLIYEDLQLLSAPLSTLAKSLAPSPTPGVARRLPLESQRLLRRKTPTSVPMVLCTALAEARQDTSRAIYATLSPSLTPLCPLPPPMPSLLGVWPPRPTTPRRPGPSQPLRL